MKTLHLLLIAVIFFNSCKPKGAGEQAQQSADSTVTDSLSMESWQEQPQVTNKPLLSINAVPVLNIADYAMDTAAGTIRINYDLYDKENDPCEIMVTYSADTGRTYLGRFESITGDTGTLIKPGKKKTLLCHYNRASFHPAALIRISATDHKDPDWNMLAKQVSQKRLEQDILLLSMVRNFKTPEGVKNLSDVKDTMQGRWQRFGLQSYRQGFDYFGYAAHNVVGRQAGIQDEAATILVGGHFDTVKDSPGADDNATGVAAILEISRILSNYHLEKSVKFIGFDLEEEGLIGSKQYLTGKGRAAYEQAKEAVIIDMIGYTSDKDNSQVFPADLQPFFPEAYNMVSTGKFRGDFVVSIANENGKELSKQFASAASLTDAKLRIASLVVKGKGEDMPELRRGDHSNFWDAGIDALYLGDGADTRNPDYHKPTDKPEHVNFEHLAKVTRATLVTIARQAGISHADVKYLQPAKKAAPLAAKF